MKLRTKIFLVFSILATIPLFILTSFAYERHAQVIDQRITDVSERLFDNVKTTANNTLDGIRQVTGAFQFYYNDGSTVVQNLKQFADPERNQVPTSFIQPPRNLTEPARVSCFPIHIFTVFIY